MNGKMERDFFASCSPTCKTFLESMNISYADWHDGVGYNLEAFRALPGAERDLVVRYIRQRCGPSFDWRDTEVLYNAATPEAVEALQFGLTSPKAESRLRSVAALHWLGATVDMDEILAQEIARVTITDGMAFALGLIQKPVTPTIRDALLRGARDRPEVGPHYAAMLCFLVDKANSTFDWDMRPFFLKFGEHTSKKERQVAFLELCNIVCASIE